MALHIFVLSALDTSGSRFDWLALASAVTLFEIFALIKASHVP